MTKKKNSSSISSRVASSQKMKQRNNSIDGDREESWFRLDPIDLKILIRVLSESLKTLPINEVQIVKQSIRCMELALSRSETEELRNRIANGDVAALEQVMSFRSSGRRKSKASDHDNT